MSQNHASALIARLIQSGQITEIPEHGGGISLVFTRTHEYLCHYKDNAYSIKIGLTHVPYVPRDMVDDKSLLLLAEGEKNCGISLVTREIPDKQHMHTSLSIKLPKGAPEFHVGRKGIDENGRMKWQERMLNGMRRNGATPQNLAFTLDHWDYTRDTTNEKTRLNGTLYGGYYCFTYAMMLPATVSQAANIYADNLIDTNAAGIEYHSKNQTGSNCIKHPIDICQQYGINFLPELKTREINYHKITTTLVGDRVVDNRIENPASKIFNLNLGDIGNINFYQSASKNCDPLLLVDASECFAQFGQRADELANLKYDFHNITRIMKAHGYEIAEGTIKKDGKALKPEDNHSLSLEPKQTLWTRQIDMIERTKEHRTVVSGTFR